MTFHDIAGAMLRRWYLCLMILAAAGYLAWSYDKTSGSYTTSTVVIFTKPATSTLQPDNGSNDVGVISFAAAIANDINGTHTSPLYASADAPLYGAGVREGVLVGVPNAGGQWSTSLTTAEIDIRIVGRTPEWVKQQQQSILASITATTTAQQRATPADGHISARVEPLSMQIQHVLPTRSSRLIAFGAIGVAAMVSAGAASILLNGVITSVRAQRSAPADRPLTAYPAVEAQS